MNNVENLITQHLNLWTSAIKQKSSAGRGSSSKTELYGIKKLRELILELAARGLLVPQDPNDEPATELLKKISTEKTALIKEGKIKKAKPLPPLTDEEKINTPGGWTLIRTGQLFNTINSGGTPSKRNPEYWNGDIPWASVKDLGTKRHISTTQDQITELGLINGSRLADVGDILICTRMGLGKISIVKAPMAFNQDLKSVKLTSFVDVDFFLNTYSTLKIRGTGTTVEGIKQEQLLEYVIGLPPLAEQHRIVAKVDELMALCDQLEQQTEASLSAHQTLVATLLGALTNAADHDSFQQAWQRIAQHFDTLFTTEHSIDQLKQTILQLAVMGKLVPQDPNDEPASELLKRIATEKAKLVKEGKIKKQKVPTTVSAEEHPFPLKRGWEYRKLGDLAQIFSGNSFKSEDFKENDGCKVIKITNAGVGELIETADCLPIDFQEEYKNYLVFKGDLILALTRPYISTGLKISICPETYHESLLNQRVAAIRPFLDSSFLYLFMQSAYVLGLYQARFGGSGLQPNLKISDVTDLVIPVPPMPEQERIVAQVMNLTMLCDQLKARLNQAQTIQLYLADALTEQAIA
ncbi:restriction endonuclease subunit S [Spongiibacter tropicus]|uniref:restriction endonuclease subunit S n=1 Tax=Spongiibacter tropicus TaxID=454602 RepID=UPI0003B31528|nr:restriction endonuclease subunit S [Spongiibacter tropicus]